MKKRIDTNKYETTEIRILNEAVRLFLERGYNGTSIEDITKAARLTKGALYWHYRSKEDLLRRILEQFEKKFLDDLIQRIGGIEGRALDKFERMIRGSAAFAYYNPELSVCFTTLAAELVGAHHRIEPEVKRIYKKYEMFISRLIRQGKREKVFKRDLNTRLLALIIIAFSDGILLRWFMNKDEINGKAYVETYREVVLRGLLLNRKE